MRVAEFDFDLPEDLIALHPALPRDASRLLHVGSGAISHQRMSELPGLLRRGDLLVVNDTRVIRAQLGGARAARAPGGPEVQVDLTLHRRTGPAIWRAFARPAKRLAAGDALGFGDGLEGRVVSREGAEVEIEFSLEDLALDRALEACGGIPLPPYIARKRAPVNSDANDYQTVYARKPGSVAAPTAGLHFTPDLLGRLEAAGVLRESVTLHVGAGTFLPVVAEDTDGHKMHPEWGEITEEQAARINAAIAAGGRVVAVGTTTLRLLESAADASGRIRAFAGETDIFITPGYRFRVIDALMTNFHLPRSTLFMLVCAFAGTTTMHEAYRAAIAQRYRFYSFGDACLLERAQ